ncbi:MAG TPA: formate-dependent phosphoribosylglycinamide formyltransferase [Thioploca sp.]|nr:formate-dependent phosphoribosylglycinamide formyltransferase [Thioploca sp.]
MKIGTPLSQSATRVMLLGCGELGKEVIMALQRFGVETIAVDGYLHAPGHQVAHRSHVVDLSNADALYELVAQERPHFLVPESEAIATELLVEIEQDGLTKVIPTARAASVSMNREALRQLAAEELDLPTVRYAFAKSYNELQMQINRGVGYPCLVKPMRSTSGKGHSEVKGPEDVKAAWNYAMDSSGDNCSSVIVEEFIKFDYEITLLTVRAFGAAGEIETHFCEPIGYLKKQGHYVESWQPQRMTPASLHYARELAKKLTESLGGVGVFGVELLVKGDKVWFNEVCPYPHYAGMVTMATQAQNQFELHARALLGLSVSTVLREQGTCATIFGGVDADNVVFEGIDEALQVAGTDLRLFGKLHAQEKRRMGVMLATGQNIIEARQRATFAANLVRPVPFEEE